MRSTVLLAAALASVSLSGALAAQQPALPLKLEPRPTTEAITEADLMTRLYIFADDSMQGRQAGRAGNGKGTDYIARELRRLGVEPAGDNGTYFQALPTTLRKYTNKSELGVNGQALRWLTDFVAVPGNAPPKPLETAQVIYGGVAGDTANLISASAAAGKFVVLSPAPAGQGGGGGGRGGRGGRGGGGGGGAARFANAAAVATIDLDRLGPSARAHINNPVAAISTTLNPPAAPSVAPVFRITTQAAERLFGRSLQGLVPGTAGGSVSAQLDFVEQAVPEYARNVVGIIRGSDPALRNQYVAVGAHNDHVGFNTNPVDHDSARAFASEELRQRMLTDNLRNLSAEERAVIKVNVDSLRRLRRVRMDSINNGADDDGSGSMAVLEIAEAISRMPAKPRRSVLLVWHTAEESGLRGATFFTEYPTVPRDSIVAQINIDMIGRGRSTDIPGGSDDYLAVVGSKRLSEDLGNMVQGVNTRQQRALSLDYRFDGEVTWPGYNNIYGRSDHARYASRGIPIAFFFTGLHQDYHRVTDEPQYIDYPHYTRITNYINELIQEVANRDKRPAVNRPISE